MVGFLLIGTQDYVTNENEIESETEEENEDPEEYHDADDEDSDCIMDQQAGMQGRIDGKQITDEENILEFETVAVEGQEEPSIKRWY
jgi:hypothetical protein